MPGLADIRNAVSNWFQSNNLNPTGFYQTRITRTPGVVMPPTRGSDATAEYAPQTKGADIVAGSSLSPDIKNALLQTGYGSGQGFIRSEPDAPSETLRHESFHDIFAHAGLSPSAISSIGSKIDPGILDFIHSSPLYQEESKNYGQANVNADEGSALQLFTYGKKTDQLVNEIKKTLNKSGKKTELNQFERLTK